MNRNDMKLPLLVVLVSYLCVHSVAFSYGSASPFLVPDIDLTLVESECQADGTYDLKVRVDYSTARSMAFAVTLQGQAIDTLSYADVSSGDTVCISANLRGDQSMGVVLTAVDTFVFNRINAHPFFSEWHYDNAGADVGEFIEITGPSARDLSDYQVYVYDGDGPMVVLADSSGAINDTIPGALGSCGALSIERSDLSSQFFENGIEAIALVQISTGAVVDFISHEGVVTPTIGPAAGLTSINIGTEPTTTPVGQSLQLSNMGWTGPTAASPGALNTGYTTCPYDIGAVICLDTVRYDEPYCIDCDALSFSEPIINERIILCNPLDSPVVTIAPNAFFRFADLFMSEYIEGPSGQSNKCIELFNGTDQAIDLSRYSMQLYNTAPRLSPDRSLTLSGTLAAGDAYVICNNSGFTPAVDLVDTDVINYNGDDIVTLSKDGVIIDVVGRVGEDPGTAWTGGGVSTRDRVMRRRPIIYRGDDRPFDPFDPSVEWYDAGVNDPSDLGRHTLSLTSVDTFSFYDGDPALGGVLIASMQSSFDTVVTLANSPVTIWVTTHPGGTICESSAVPVTILVHPEEQGVACVGTVNIALNEDCTIGDVVSTVYNGSYDPRLFDLTFKNKNGIVVHESDLYRYRGNELTYHLIDSCTMQRCWGYAFIEAKVIPQLVRSSADTLCCSQRWQDHLELSIGDFDQQLKMGCYAPHSRVWSEVSTSGAVCDTLTTVVDYYADFAFHDQVQKTLIYTDTLTVAPAHIDALIDPGSTRVFDSLSLVDSIIIRGCTDFDPTPHNVMRYWSERIDPDDRNKNGANEGIPYAFPYLQKDSVIVVDTSLIITERQVIRPGQIVRIGAIWTHLDVIVYEYDTTQVIRIDTLPVYHALDSASTCNFYTSYSDNFGEECHPDDRILRTWEVTDWCHGVKRQMHQWIIIRDYQRPVFGVLPLNIELLGLDSAIINMRDTVALSTLASSINLRDLVRVIDITDPFECATTFQIPKFSKFRDNCTAYEDIFFEYSYDVKGPYEDPNTPGLIRNIPPGITEITINATDECGNKATPHRLVVIALDRSPPRPICHDTIRVTLTQDYRTPYGFNRIPLSAFDLSTVDACGNILFTLGIRKDFKFFCGEDSSALLFVNVDYIEVCCEDLNIPIPLELTYFDRFGNSSKCSSVLIVEDKAIPRVVCDTLMLQCGETPTADLLVDKLLLTGTVCQNSVVVRYRRPEGRQACGGSEDVDIYIDEKYQCTLHVIYDESDKFDPYTIRWPLHHDGRSQLGIQRECLDDNGDKKVLRLQKNIDHHPHYSCSASAASSVPLWCQPDCGIVQATYEIDTFSSSSSCYSLIKRWTVIDWCVYRPNEAEAYQYSSFELVDDTWLDGSACSSCVYTDGSQESVYYRYNNVKLTGIYTYDQVFVVLDTVPPMITVVSDTLSACNGPQLIEAYATDVCLAGDTLSADMLIWDFDVAVFDADEAEISSTSGRGYGAGVSTQLEENSGGAYARVTWTAQDKCGNSAQYISTHYFVDEKTPTPICLLDVSTVTMQNGTVQLWASDLDRGSFDQCSSVAVEIAVDADPQRRGSSITLSCDDAVSNRIAMRLYAIDASGNEDYCTFFITVQAGCSVEASQLTGVVRTLYEEPISEATIDVMDLDGRHLANTQSSKLDGSYSILASMKESVIDIVASKNNNHLEGISTLDLVKIQQHLLGIEPFTRPDQLIAADVNGDGRISSTDIVQLRQLMLGHIDELPDQDSWLIIPDEYYAAGMNYPFNRVIRRSPLKQMKQNFYAIKIGDVGRAEAVSRSRNSAMHFHIGTPVESEGGHLLPVYADQITQQAFAIQLYMKVSGIKALLPGQWDIKEEEYSIDKSILNVITIADEPHTIDPSSPLFYIVTDENFAYRVAKLDTEPSILWVADGKQRLVDISNYEQRKAKEVLGVRVQPNPFRVVTSLNYTTSESSDVTIKVWNSMGQLVYYDEEVQSAGHHQIQLSRQLLGAQGIYIYQLQIGLQQSIGRLSLID